MKCSHCGKEVDEGIATCPRCGNETTESMQGMRRGTAYVKRVAFAEKKKPTREELVAHNTRMEILWAVILVASVGGGIAAFVHYSLEGMIAAVMVFIMSIRAINYNDRKRRGGLNKGGKGQI